MSTLQDRIVRAGRKVQVERKNLLSSSQIDAYEQAILLCIPQTIPGVVVSQVDRFRDGIVIGFLSSDSTNLHEVAIAIQERHRSIIHEIAVLADRQSIHIHFRALAPFRAANNIVPAIVLWIVAAVLFACKTQLLGRDPYQWTFYGSP